MLSVNRGQHVLHAGPGLQTILRMHRADPSSSCGSIPVSLVDVLDQRINRDDVGSQILTISARILVRTGGEELIVSADAVVVFREANRRGVRGKEISHRP